MSDRNGPNSKWCNACRVRFTIYARRRKKIMFCPVCGESIDVVPYAERDKTHEIPRRPWTTGEQAELCRLIEKGKRPIELASRFNRSEESIKKRAKRLGYKFD